MPVILERSNFDSWLRGGGASTVPSISAPVLCCLLGEQRGDPNHRIESKETRAHLNVPDFQPNFTSSGSTPNG
jgi:hypothetical protein